jgi:hypothetical protein
VKDARLDGVSRRSQEFKALKLGVVSLWSIEEKHGRLRPPTRSSLIHALLVEQNVQLAWQLVGGPEQNSNGSSVVTRIVSYWSGSRGEETFRTQMKTAAANLPDSQFLQRLESTDDKDLRSTVQDAKALAHKELSRSIDTAVNNMTHAVLAMQQDNCKMAVQVEVDNEERKALSDALVKFIREINTKSAGQQNS